MRASDSFRRGIVAAVIAFGVARGVEAQVAAGVTQPRALEMPSHAQGVTAGSSGAFLLEAIGGSLGSLAGIAAIGLTANCGVDDLGCVILSVGAGGALGVVGATIGTTIAARYTGARRSIAGAVGGAVVGTGVGLGVHWLLNSSSDRNLGDAIVVPIFVISQGTIAALGSRLLGSAPATR